MNLGDLFVSVKGYLDGRAALESVPGTPDHPELVGVSIVFGPRELARQMNQGVGRARRIAFVYGDDTGKAGVYVGANPKAATLGGARVIQTLEERGEIHVWGFDASDPTSQLAQYQACKALEKWVHRALRRVRMGFVELGEATWVLEPRERALGAALIISIATMATVHDEETDAVPTGPATIDGKTFLGATQDCGEEEP